VLLGELVDEVLRLLGQQRRELLEVVLLGVLKDRHRDRGGLLGVGVDQVVEFVGPQVGSQVLRVVGVVEVILVGQFRCFRHLVLVGLLDLDVRDDFRLSLDFVLSLDLGLELLQNQRLVGWTQIGCWDRVDGSFFADLLDGLDGRGYVVALDVKVILLCQDGGRRLKHLLGEDRRRGHVVGLDGRPEGGLGVLPEGPDGHRHRAVDGRRHPHGDLVVVGHVDGDGAGPDGGPGRVLLPLLGVVMERGRLREGGRPAVLEAGVLGQGQVGGEQDGEADVDLEEEAVQREATSNSFLNDQCRSGGILRRIAFNDLDITGKQYFRCSSFTGANMEKSNDPGQCMDDRVVPSGVSEVDEKIQIVGVFVPDK
jgi:hypothetical protein